MSEFKAPTAKQLTTLENKVDGWLTAFYQSQDYTDLLRYNKKLDQQQIRQLTQTFAQGMLTSFGRQPSRWTITSMDELLNDQIANFRELVVADENVTEDEVVLDVLSDILTFAGQQGFIRNGEQLGDHLVAALGAMDSEQRITTIATHIGDAFRHVQQFYNLNDIEHAQNPEFLGEHLVDVLILAENVSFIDMAMIAALAANGDEMSRDDFVESWLRQYALPEINVKGVTDDFTAALGMAPQSDEFQYSYVMTQLHNDMTPVSPANRLAVAMRLEGLELGGDNVADAINFHQKHKAALAAESEMLNYLPTEVVSRKSKEKNGRKNNVLSFAAAKKLQKKRNKGK